MFETLPVSDQDSIAKLVQDMARDMATFAGTFDRQGGVLISEDQVSRYSHGVIGHPTMFVLSLIGLTELSPEVESDAMDVSEMIQLANITRDIEKDLERGIGYHPALRPLLGRQPAGQVEQELVLRSREQHLRTALRRVPAFRRLCGLAPMRRSGALRAAAVLMLGFTDLHYRQTAMKVGHEPWKGPRNSFGVVLRALPALVSRRWAASATRRIERNFVEMAMRLPSEWDFTTSVQGVDDREVVGQEAGTRGPIPS
jgi:hypothetical protein